jgi:hypothetical protein
MARAGVARSARVRGWWAAGLGAIVVLVFPMPSSLVEEFYSRLIYRWVQSGVTAISNLVPFAILDALILVAIVAVVLRVLWLVHAAWQGGVVTALAEGARRLVRAVGLLVVLFVVAWGFNYRRLPLEATVSGNPAPRPTVQTLEVALGEAAAMAASLRRAVSAESAWDMPEVAAALEEPMNVALARLKLPPLGRPGRPKTSFLLTDWFTVAGVNGMVNPLALESIVHTDLLPFERPFVLAHEWAHLAGHADEAEANAIGWFACMHGGAHLGYSASLYLIMEASAALPVEPRRRALARLNEGVREDLMAIGRRMQAERPRVRRAASRVYDEYLKANRVEDGTASYSRALTLILSTPLREALPAYRGK